MKWLEEHKKITVEEMKALALNTYCPQYDRWVVLVEATQKSGKPLDATTEVGAQGIREWNGYADANSPGALKYYYWQHADQEDVARGLQ